MSDGAITGTSVFRRWLLCLLATVVAVVLCVRYVDLPVASFANAHLNGTLLLHWIHGVFQLADLVIPLALAVLFIAGCRSLAGKPLPSWMVAPLLCSWALVWAVPATLVFKYVFGRTPADPYVEEGSHEWDFFSGSPLRTEGHDSFPSGTMAAAGSIVAVLWILYPRLRLLWATIYVLVAIGLVLANSHFVGDVIAGAFLGLTIGWMTLRLLTRPSEHT